MTTPSPSRHKISRPRRGGALCFPHGDHPLSPLHEGAPLRPGGEGAPPKFVIRTEVLYATAEAPAQQSDAWASSNYAAAMLHASNVWTGAG